MQRSIKSLLISLFFSFSSLGALATTVDEVPTSGFDHVGLTVTNLQSSSDFFTETLGWSLRGKDEAYPAHFLSDGNMLVTLWQVKDSNKAVSFNRKQNVGLHHLAISVKSFEALDKLYEKLRLLENVEIEFAPELAFGGPAKHMMIREPSGNRLEFIHKP